MNKLTFRRFDKSNNRFVYQDTFSWRGYYDSHIGGKWVYDRTDRVDAFLAEWEMFTGKFDKNGTPIYVGDIVEHSETFYTQCQEEDSFCWKYDIVWNENNMAIEVHNDIFADGMSLDDINFQYCEVIGNIHQNEEFVK